MQFEACLKPALNSAARAAAQGRHPVPTTADHVLSFSAVTTSSPTKTLYIMSDTKVSALTTSVMGEATSVPLKLPGIQPSSSASSPPSPVTFATSPCCVVSWRSVVLGQA